MADMYPKERYGPKLFKLGNDEFSPRFETVHLYEPLPEVPENTVDVRALPSIASPRTYPDIYILPTTIERTIRHLRRRHGKKIIKTAIAIAITGSVFTVTLIALTIFAKNDIVAGYSELSRLSPNAETSEIKRQIGFIHDRFERASWLFLPMKYLIGKGILRHETLENGYHALYAGTAISELLTLTDGIQTDFSNSYSGAELSGYLDPRMFLNTRIPLTEYLKDNREPLLEIMKNVSQAQFHFSSITTTGNVEQDLQLSKLSGLLKNLETLSAYAAVHGDEILDLLGDKKPMNYLILNQNRDELRAN